MGIAIIPGGYYMKARKILKSDIAHAPPHVREIFDLFLCKAFHSDGDELKRGQLLITYDGIRESLHWMVGWRKMQYSKWDCEKAMKWLKKATMITTRKTTVGMVITICNYDTYQTPENYESHTCNSPPKATRKPQSTDTIDKNSIKEENKNNEKKSALISFDDFWEIWPRKVAKDPARERWVKINPDEQFAKQIIAAVRSQMAAGILKADKFTPHPATWLNAGRWTDQLPKEAEQASRRRSEADANARKSENQRQDAAAKARSNLKFAETLKQMSDAQLTTFWLGSKAARPEIERLRPDRKELFEGLAVTGTD